MKAKKYPTSLFLVGLIFSMVIYYYWFSIPCIIAFIAGVFYRPFTLVAFGLLVIDLFFSLIQNMRMRNAFLKKNSNPDLQDFQNAVSNQSGWQQGIAEFMGQKINNPSTAEEKDDKIVDSEDQESP